jgi:hypothetical protein
MRLTRCLLKTSESLQTKFAAVAHLAEGQFLKNELTRTKENLGASEWELE